MDNSFLCSIGIHLPKEHEVIAQKTVILNSYRKQEREHTKIRKCQERNELNTLVLSTSHCTNFLE
jgi:hypothetical protein